MRKLLLLRIAERGERAEETLSFPNIIKIDFTKLCKKFTKLLQVLLVI